MLTSTLLLLCSGTVGLALSLDNGTQRPKTALAQHGELLESLKNPVSWASWGFDLRTRLETFQNAISLQADTPDSDYNYIRLRSRLWTEIRPVTNLTLNARFSSEPRFFFRPAYREGWASQEGLFDALNVEYSNIANQPITAKIGRQEILFGDRWLIFDGTPADGSRTEFFDAARLTIALAPKASLDLLAIAVRSEANAFLPVINDRNLPLAEQDETAGVAYFTYDLRPEVRVESYYIYRQTTPQLSNGDEAELHLAGTRIAGRLSRAWDYFIQGAPQFGQKNGEDLFAYGLNAQLTWNASDPWRNSVYVGYEYLSGDDPDSQRDEGWDPVWSRRVRWSELMVLAMGIETGGRRGYWTNLQRPYMGWTAQPADWLRLQTAYMPLFANENPRLPNDALSSNGFFRGHLLQAIARFRFTPNLTGHLWGELLAPGSYYAPDHRDTATFFRAELSWTL